MCFIHRSGHHGLIFGPYGCHSIFTSFSFLFLCTFPFLDPELKHACRAITAYLKLTNVEDLYLLAPGTAPPDIRRDVCARIETNKSTIKHTPFGHTPATNRLKSRCFLYSVPKS